MSDLSNVSDSDVEKVVGGRIGGLVVIDLDMAGC